MGLICKSFSKDPFERAAFRICIHYECYLKSGTSLLTLKVSAFFSVFVHSDLTIVCFAKHLIINFSVVATDTAWETKIEWHRTNAILGESEVSCYFFQMSCYENLILLQ